MLNAAQQLTFRSDVLADPVLSALTPGGDSSLEIAAAYNALAAPDFWVWRTATPVSDVFNAIVWANLTPTDAPDGTQAWANRSLAAQGKQFNVQTLLAFRDTLASGRPNVRAGLHDALTAVPSGAGGALKNAGWSAVRTAMQRRATRLERLFATGTGTTATPADLVVDGLISASGVQNAMGW